MPTVLINLMIFYSFHVIVEYNLSGSKIICRQIYDRLLSLVQLKFDLTFN